MSLSPQSKIDRSLHDSLQAKQAFWGASREAFFKVAEIMKSVLKNGNKILICGNGGSACDAMHFAGELVNRYQKDRPGLSCISLNSDGALLTCIANDYAFDRVFARQVQAHGRPGDLLIAISTSGNSENIYQALLEAKKTQMKSLALLGGSGGKIKATNVADETLCVASSTSTPRIQEVHEWILHSLCEYTDL